MNERRAGVNLSDIAPTRHALASLRVAVKTHRMRGLACQPNPDNAKMLGHGTDAPFAHPKMPLLSPVERQQQIFSSSMSELTELNRPRDASVVAMIEM